MNSDILSQVKKVNELLVNSDIYREYSCALKKLDDREKHLIYSFKLKIKTLRLDKNKSFEQKKVISYEYSNMILNKNIKSFLHCEQKLIKYVKNIYFGFLDGVDIDLFS